MGMVILLITIYIGLYLLFLFHIIYEYNNLHEAARKLADIERQLNARQVAMNNPLKRMSLARFDSKIVDAYKKQSNYYAPERLAKVLRFRKKVINFPTKWKV